MPKQYIFSSHRLFFLSMGFKLASESLKIHEIPPLKLVFCRRRFLNKFRDAKKNTILSIFGLKMVGCRHELGPMEREPEGGFHPPWRVITTSRSEAEWNVVNLLATGHAVTGVETPRRIFSLTAHAAHPLMFFKVC